jgi:hypothetical protein
MKGQFLAALSRSYSVLVLSKWLSRAIVTVKSSLVLSWVSELISSISTRASKSLGYYVMPSVDITNLTIGAASLYPK